MKRQMGNYMILHEDITDVPELVEETTYTMMMQAA